MARCCKPESGDEIIGYITLGEGISIHRKDCINILQISDSKRARLVAVEWGHKVRNSYAVNIVISAYNRRGLVRDISAVVSAEKVDIISMESATDKDANKATFRINIEVPNIDSLGSVLDKIQEIPNIIDVYRDVL